jgi:hypothetical protein
MTDNMSLRATNGSVAIQRFSYSIFFKIKSIHVNGLRKLTKNSYKLYFNKNLYMLMDCFVANAPRNDGGICHSCASNMTKSSLRGMRESALFSLQDENINKAMKQ